jgi:hypothetical protein
MYVGQTGSKFSTRYKEHKTAFRNNSYTSNFAKNVLEEVFSFGPINNNMQIVHCSRKEAHLNKTQRFHIHIEFAIKKTI